MSLGIYHGGAGWVGGPQLDARLSLGGKRSGTRVECLSARMVAGLRGLRVVALGPGVSNGLGVLRAVGEGVSWESPGSGQAGAVTPVAGGARAVVLDVEEGAGYVVVERLDSLPMGGSAVVQCVEVFNNALGGRDFTPAENTAGVVQYGGVFLRNEGTAVISSLKAWVSTFADGGVSVGLEGDGGDGEVQLLGDDVTAPTGITWTALLSEAGAVEVANVPVGGGVFLWWKRELEADNGGVARGRNAFVVSVDGTEVLIGGLFRVEAEPLYAVLAKEGERPTIADVVWAGAELGAWSWEGANLTEGVWYVHALEVSAYGVTGAVSEVVLTVNAAGEVVPNAPGAPEGVGVVSVGGGGVLVMARYEPEVEGETFEEVEARRGNAFVVRMSTDGTDAALGDAVRVGMEASTGGTPEVLWWESGAVLDGAPVQVFVSVERDLSWPDFEAVVSLDGAQMDPPNAGTETGTATFTFTGPDEVQLVLTHTIAAEDTGEIQLWAGAPGTTGTYVRRLAIGLEAVLMTFTRAEWEEYTSAPHYILVENDAGDDIRGDIPEGVWVSEAVEGPGVYADVVHQVSGVRRVKARAFNGQDALAFPPAVGSSGTVVVDEAKGIELVYGPGSLELWGNGVLCLRCIWRGVGNADNGVYIPTEFGVSVDTYAGGAAGENAVVGAGTWDGVNKEVVLRARGVNLARWDVETLEVSLNGGLVDAAGMPGGSYGGEQGAYARWAESLLSVFDAEGEGALAMVSLAAVTGVVSVRGKLDFSLDAAAVEAL